MKEYIGKAVLFDLFGTLCGATSPEWTSIYKFNKNPKIHPMIQRAVCGTKFTNMDDYLNGFCESLEIESNVRNKETLMNIIEEELEKAEKNIPEERKETLEYLLNQGYKLAIVSNSYPPTKEILIRKTELSNFFKDPYIVLIPKFRDQDYTDLITRLKPDTIAVTKNDPFKVRKIEQAKLVNAKVVEVINRIPNKSTTHFMRLSKK